MRAPPETVPATLEAIQAEFSSALFEGQRVPRDLRCAGSMNSSRRFDIYRNNMLTSLIGCLRSTYPAVCRLVGDDFFNAATHLFVELRPPVTPVLLEYGAGFDAFLQSFEPARSLPYLADVARLEWLFACACHAQDAESIDGTALADMTAHEAAQARLLLHPSLRLMRSPFPAVSIWQMNRRDGDSLAIESPSCGEAAMIVRPRFSVEVAQLDRGAFEFVAALRSGYPLAKASTFAAQSDADFDLAAAIIQIFAAGAVVDIVPAGQPHPLLQPSKGPSHA